MNARLLLCSIVAISLSAFCGSFTVSWDRHPEPGVTYRVHMGTNSGSYQTNWATTSTTLVISNAPSGTNWLVVTAEKDGITSDPSNEIQAVVPSAPTGIRIVPVVETSGSPLGPWESFAVLPETWLAVTNQTAFYRVKLETRR